jgi:hypothetical protein
VSEIHDTANIKVCKGEPNLGIRDIGENAALAEPTGML